MSSRDPGTRAPTHHATPAMVAPGRPGGARTDADVPAW